MNAKKPFSPEEIKFLKQNYPVMGRAFCADTLKRTESSISHFCSRYKIKVNEDRLKLTQKQNIESALKTNREKIRTYSVNPEQFLNIQTPEVAYILGLIWADGYVNNCSRRSTITLGCLYSDLINVERVFDSTGKWCKYISNRENKKTQLRLVINNRIIADFLQENDYIAKSTASACKILSKIPEHLKHYWFRGLFDGDGCFYLNTKGKSIEKSLEISSSYTQDWTFLESILQKFQIKYTVLKKQQAQNGKMNHCSIVRIRNLHGIKTMGSYIYNNIEKDGIGFVRKYNKYNEILNCFSDLRPS